MRRPGREFFCLSSSLLGWLILFDPGAQPPVQSTQSLLFVRPSSWPSAPDLSHLPGRFQESEHELGGEFLDRERWEKARTGGDKTRTAVEIRSPGMPSRSCGERA